MAIAYEAGKWQRDGTTIFKLMETGWHKNHAQLKNEFYFHVIADPDASITAEELAQQILELLQASSPQPA